MISELIKTALIDSFVEYANGMRRVAPKSLPLFPSVITGRGADRIRDAAVNAYVEAANIMAGRNAVFAVLTSDASENGLCDYFSRQCGFSREITAHAQGIVVLVRSSVQALAEAFTALEELERPVFYFLDRIGGPGLPLPPQGLQAMADKRFVWVIPQGLPEEAVSTVNSTSSSVICCGGLAYDSALTVTKVYSLTEVNTAALSRGRGDFSSHSATIVKNANPLIRRLNRLTADQCMILCSERTYLTTDVRFSVPGRKIT